MKLSLAHLARGARRVPFPVVAVLAVGASAFVGWAAAGHHASWSAAGGSAKVTRIVHAEGAGGSVTAITADGRQSELAEGATVAPGTTLVTGPRARARVELGTGAAFVLDRDTRLGLGGPAGVTLEHGQIAVDVADGAALDGRAGLAKVHASGARFVMTADDARTDVAVARGDVALTGGRDDITVHPGEEAEVDASGKVAVTATSDLGQRIAFGGLAEGTQAARDDSDAPPSGVGELRARKPGTQDEIEGAVRLARHDVKARIAGEMARTEIDETFVNTTDRELEGVWRFALPAGATLERLALEVDGALVEGEFVDTRKASGIWRGVIQHAAPQAPRPVEEIVWVPGPWRDPALLEWRRGGRAELRIFPIPRRGTRRVVVAYTEHVAPAGAVRRYVLPMTGGAGAPTIDEASFDVRVVGADPAVGLRARGYDLTPSAAAPNESPSAWTLSRTAFVPGGDLTVEYATKDLASEASAFGFAPVGTGEDGFVALSLRPQLPPRIAERGRDQVVVVDTGRSMFGERVRRASRLAIELAQQMDRRDRVTVLACDLACRAMPGGWHAPGASTAHDVDAFLAGIEADGASDLAGAVRAAATVAGRDGARDLRVLVLSDGVASAGVRGKARLADTIAASMADPRASLVAVPLGNDADSDTLGEIARGGGGAVVPYGPGVSLESAALDVLATSYGAMLRDVELTLPAGLHDAAPAALPPMRAGAETLVAARLTGDHAAGDVVLRGKLAGEPFEARWPVDVRAVADDGNAWVARTWAAERVADDERNGDATARAEAVTLSHRFRVPSRSTSLLVLESAAMFRAFGIDRSAPAFQWSGESEAQGEQMGDVAATAAGHVAGLTAGAGEASLSMLGALSGGGAGAGVSRDAPSDPYRGDDERRAEARPAAPAPMTAASPAPAATASAPQADAASGFAQPPMAKAAPAKRAVSGPWDPPTPPRRPGRWMRRVWFRVAAISPDARPVVESSKVELARAALVSSPDLRQRHAELAKLLVRQGNADELEAAASRWSTRDPLDPDLLTVRAAARAWRGDRDGSLRILSGMLASPAASTGALADIATALARAEERAQHPELACSLRAAAAESRPDDVPALSEAVACERTRGDEASATRWLTTAKDDATRARVTAAAAKRMSAGRAEDPLFGDVVVDASWDDGSDLDLAVVDPGGRRLTWASTARGVRARDCTSRAHEALAISSGATGAFAVEVVRAGGEDAGRASSRGVLRITSAGQTRTVPFVLTGDRAQIARVDLRFDSRLEPVGFQPW